MEYEKDNYWDNLQNEYVYIGHEHNQHSAVSLENLLIDKTIGYEESQT